VDAGTELVDLVEHHDAIARSRLADCLDDVTRQRADISAATATDFCFVVHATEALGTAAVIVPPLATLSITIVIGWVLIAGGISGLATTFRIPKPPGFGWSLISGLLGAAEGAALLVWPARGAFSLTLLLIAFFIIEGIATIMFGLQQRRHVSRWSWMIASGGVDLVLAAILLTGFPGTETWALGLLVGIDMIFGGAALAGIALHSRTHPMRDAASEASPIVF
jgi:uncharacterized membrane protein HdeD (DUF308 family)